MIFILKNEAMIQDYPYPAPPIDTTRPRMQYFKDWREVEAFIIKRFISNGMSKEEVKRAINVIWDTVKPDVEIPKIDKKRFLWFEADFALSIWKEKKQIVVSVLK